MSERTIQRAKEEGDDFIFGIQYAPSTKKQRVTEEKFDEATEFLASNLQPVSGRDYFIMSASFSNLYEKYVDETDAPLSRTFLEHKVFTQFKIHHVTGAPHCIYCNGRCY